MGNEAEKFFEGCKNMKDLRMNGGDYQHEIIETLKPAKQLMNTIMQRLELKEKSFQSFNSASKTELDDFWSILLTVEPLLTKDNISKDTLKKFPSLFQFISHCCVFKKYAITIKKCGQKECSICKPVRMPMERFSGQCVSGL